MTDEKHPNGIYCNNCGALCGYGNPDVGAYDCKECGDWRGDNDAEPEEKNPFITVFDLGKFRGVKEENGSVSAGAFIDVGLPFMGGCQSCGATCAAYNMCPTNTGNCSCMDCVHSGNGFSTVEEANRFCFPEEYAWLGVGRVADKTEPDQLGSDYDDWVHEGRPGDPTLDRLKD